LCLALSKLLRPPGDRGARAALRLPALPEAALGPLSRSVPTIVALFRKAEGALRAHERFEREVGDGDLGAFGRWALSALRVAAYWTPVCLLAMLAGAVLAAPLKLVSGGLGLAGTPEGQWLLRQPWPRLVARSAALGVLQQAFVAGAFAGLAALLRRAGAGPGRAAASSAAAVGAALLGGMLYHGLPWMKAAPLLGVELALLYAYARTGTLLVPCAANLVFGLASLYSARMIVLLSADLGSVDALPGIPGLRGVLAVLAASLGLFAVLAAARRRFPVAEARARWESVRALGAWWREPAELPKSPLALVPAGLLWGIAVYLAGYLSYYAVHVLAPAHETVPPALKQVLLMPLDMLVYVFLIGAALEELIFRYGLFGALERRWGFWPAALVSSAVFSGFHFVDLSGLVRFLGVSVSKLLQSLMIVYGFSWAGFAGRVAAGLVLAALYSRSRILLIPMLSHFTSNLLEAVGLRWGLPCFLACVAAIFALQLLDRSRPKP
jgi:membrane protease YdiL (CAAX protease family)